MPPPGCSPIAPSVSTRRCISSAVMSFIALAQSLDAGKPRSDVGGFEALVARRVEASVGQVLGQVPLLPALGVVSSEIVAVAVVATIAHATHQPSHRVAQVQRHGIVA